MYLFFTIAGFLFTVGLSIVLHYIYNIFSVNKITGFLNPQKDTIFNKISISIIPLLLWSFIEVPILGSNYYFILGLILNIFLTCSISYIIRYGYSLISNKENEILNILSITISLLFGFIVNYICLLLGKEISLEVSVIGILIITVFYIIIKVFPPKSEFFRGISE